jgi:O-antigen/teichoic acid export membrane protein
MSELKKFSRQTAVYTLGNLIYRAASFLLVPLYVHSLQPSAYGSLELLTVTSSLVQAVLAAGIAHSALRFYFEYDAPESKAAVISTALITSFAVAGAGALLCVLLAPVASRWLFGTEQYTLAFRIACAAVIFEISREVNLAFVRARQQASRFMAVALLQLGIQVAANLYTVVHLQMGVLGILIGNFITTFSVWLLLTVMTVRQVGLRFELDKLSAMLRYGYPLTISILGNSVFQALDRYFLNSFANLGALGIYALDMRIANFVPVLLITPFTNGYGPFRFSIMKQENARATYARVLTYFTMASTFVVLGLASVSREIVAVMASKEYAAAAPVLPLMLIPGWLSGMIYCLQTGIYIQKRTRTLLSISVVAGLIDVVCLVALVPRLGVTGAAWAGVASAVYTLVHTYSASQRIYPVRYETARLVRILAIGGGLAAVTLSFSLENVWQSAILKLLLTATFPFLLGVAGVYDAEEIRWLRGLWGRALRRAEWGPALS